MAALKSENRTRRLTGEAARIPLCGTHDSRNFDPNSIDPATLKLQREVGRQKLPSTVIGLLVHIAEHTQRHVGQVIATAKIVRSMRESRGWHSRSGEKSIPRVFDDPRATLWALSEADANPGMMVDLEEAKPLFPDTDVVVVVGACEVVNPAAAATW